MNSTEAYALLKPMVAVGKYEACFGQDHDHAGWTLLHKAMAYDCRRCAHLLLHEGAHVSFVDRQVNLH